MIVDIHNHILPGLDDGAQTMEDAILLAANAVENGVTHIIATPHHNEKYWNDPKQIKEAVLNLTREIALKKIPIKILPGQEINFYNGMHGDIGDQLLTLANSGKYILIEFPNYQLPSFLFDILFQIQLKGFIPIIVHPERNLVLRKNKQLVYELVTKGALIQITASSLIGVDGFKIKKYTRDLLNHNLVHFISSDSHHHLSRPFLLKEAYQYVQKKFSEKLLTYFIENAKHVLFGTEFQPLTPIGFKKVSN
ncbi:tyrosine-protein phosphatase [Psychrobacillus sp. NPDC096389]|uniref:tyrosine-protein phosphatase n=1 Tax=Psychrobacillus sp. NPDC096389 TaxID=3364490 RepID=UPI003809F97C